MTPPADRMGECAPGKEALDALDLRLKDNFDRVEIIGRLRVVERGERTMYERELETEVATVRRSLSALREEAEQLREERDAYRIEGDHGHDDYEDAEDIIRQIAEKRPNQSFDPWASGLCQEFLDRPRRSRATIATIRDRAEAAEAELARYREGLREIADVQQEVLAIIRDNGFVFDSIGKEPGNWQHLAFTIYNEVCRIDVIARNALDIPIGERALLADSASEAATAKGDET